MPSKPAFEAVIFDCDGTLVDSEPLHAQTLEAALGEFGIKPAHFSEFNKQFSGKSVKCVYDTLCATQSLAASYEDFLATALARTKAVFARQLKAAPYAHEVLRHLPLLRAVASNGIRESVLLSLHYTGLDTHFPGGDSLIATACQVANPKPHPDVYQRAAARLSIPANACLAIEDSPTGVLAAGAAGMTVIGYTGLSDDAELAARLLAAGAHHIIADLRQILTYTAA